MDELNPIDRTISLVRASNRSREVNKKFNTYIDKNKSGVRTHALFLRPFQWEDNRIEWMREETASINTYSLNGKMIALKFLRKLMILSGMILNREGLHRGETYPFEFEKGDIIKLAIISDRYPAYPPFENNEGCYIVCTKDSYQFGLDVYPLSYKFDVLGSIHKQIKFDGLDVYPDAYMGSISCGQICHTDIVMTLLLIENLTSKVHRYKTHPLPLHSSDQNSMNYDYIISEFEHNSSRYKFLIPYNLRLRNKATKTIQRTMLYQTRDSNSFTCELISYDGTTYTIFVHDYLLVKGTGLFRDEIYESIWAYFKSESIQSRFANRHDMMKWFEGLQDFESIESKFMEKCTDFNLKAVTLKSVSRSHLRMSMDDTPRLQFEFDPPETVYTYNSLSQCRQEPDPKPSEPTPET